MSARGTADSHEFSVRITSWRIQNPTPALVGPESGSCTARRKSASGSVRPIITICCQ